MARIVGVHGIGQQDKDAADLQRHWWESLVYGEERVGLPSTPKDDFQLVYYADLYSLRGVRALDSSYDLHDLSSGWEEDFLISLGAEAALLLQADETTTRWIKVDRNLQRALNLLLKVPGMGKVSDTVVIRWIKEVHRYLNEEDLRQKAKERVHASLGDTKVVVAHSLGSVVAYEALCEDSKGVELFITLGSPLGIRKLIYDKLKPNPGQWPGAIQRWVNIAQPSDVVALSKQLDALFDSKDVRHVEDILVPDPAGLFHAHDVDRYLSRPEVVKIIRE